MKRTYSSMQTTTPPPSTSTPSPAIGLEQFEQFASMFNSFSEQFALMKNSKQGSTPQSTSDNDWIGIGSQSRTSSEKSDQTTESSSSKLSSQSNRKKRKFPTDHRHFKYQPRILTLKEFK